MFEEGSDQKFVIPDVALELQDDFEDTPDPETGLFLPESLVIEQKIIEIDGPKTAKDRIIYFVRYLRENLNSPTNESIVKGGVVVAIGLGIAITGTDFGVPADTVLGAAAVGAGMKHIVENTIFKKERQ